MKKILAVGEIIWDVYPDKSVIVGAPFNFAAHASLCGAQSALVSAVGNDELGRDALVALQSYGVDARYVKRVPQTTGRCIVTLDQNSVPSYNVLREVAYDNIRITEEDIQNIKKQEFDAFYFGTLIQRMAVSRKAVRDIVKSCSFSEILCDVNLRPDCYDEDSVRFCLENATVIKISMEEEPILRSFGLYCVSKASVENIARAICNSFHNIKIILLTLGKDGSYAYDARSDREYYQQALGDTVVSTVGAGDSFSAAWLTHYLNQESLEICMSRASAISGFVVAHLEAVPRYSMDEVISECIS